MNYEEVVTSEAIERHLKTIEEREAKEEADRESERRLAREKVLKIARLLSPATQRSKSVWPKLHPLVEEATMPTFQIIASHIKENFICAGSYPAAMLASA